jgi:peptidyl-prolyl cis-trans isomerase D
MLRWKNKGLKQLDGKKILKHSGAYTTLLVAVLAMSFFGVCDPNRGMQAPAGLAAKVDGEVISGNEFRSVYQNQYRRLQTQLKDGFDPAAFKLASRILEQLVDGRISYNGAVKAGIRASDAEVTSDFADSILKEKQFLDANGKFSQSAFEKYLRAIRTTEAELIDSMRRYETVSRLSSTVGGAWVVGEGAALLQHQLSETKVELEYLKLSSTDIKTSVTADEASKFASSDEGKKKIQEYYEGHQNEFKTQQQVRARHILIGFEGSRNATAEGAKRKKDAARSRALDILAKVRSGGDFAALAKQFTDEESGKLKGGDLGFFSRDMMVKEFSDAAFSMKTGQISDLVESPFGFHIIKVDEVKPGRDESLDQATSGIAKKLLTDEKRPILLRDLAAKFADAARKSSADIESFRKENGLIWKSTGEFALTASFIPELGGDGATMQAIGSLKDVGQIATSLIEQRGAHYLVRLKKKTLPDLSKLTVERKREIRTGESFKVASRMLASLQKQWKEDLSKRGKIWENPDYRNLDARNSVAEAGDSGPAGG